MVWSPCRRLCEVSSGQLCIDQLFLSPGWILVSFQSTGHWLSLLNWFLCTLLLGEETCANGITAFVSLLSRSLFVQAIFFFCVLILCPTILLNSYFSSKHFFQNESLGNWGVSKVLALQA